MAAWIVEHWQSIVDWAVRGGFTSGLLWNSWKYAKDRRARRARLTTDEAKAEVEGRTVDNKIMSSSITTIEAGQAAMLHAFEQERQSMDRTIDHLRVQLTERDHAIERLEERDVASQAKIAELRTEVDLLQKRLMDITTEFTEQLRHVSEQLKALQGPVS